MDEKRVIRAAEALRVADAAYADHKARLAALEEARAATERAAADELYRQGSLSGAVGAAQHELICAARDLPNVRAWGTLTRETATPEHFAELWGDKGARDTFGVEGGNMLFREQMWGGLPADWIRDGHIPDVPPERLRTMTAEELHAWQRAKSRGNR